MDNIFDYRSLSSKLKYIIKTENVSDQNQLMIDALKFTTYTQSIYWLEIIVFELIGVKKSIDKLEFIFNNTSKETPIKRNILEEHEIYTELDIAVNKLFSANEKIAQLINCVFELGLKEYGFDTNVVSYNKVKNYIKAKNNDLYLLLENLNDFDEYKDLKCIRNAFVHHYNPFHLSNYLSFMLDRNQITLSSQDSHLKTIFPFDDEKFTNPLWLKASIEKMEIKFQEVLPKIVDIINKYYIS